MEQPSYYATIPANVRYDSSLMMGAKLMYGEITCLSSKTGQCFASNEYFKNLYSVSDRQIQNRIKSLLDGGYITRHLVYKDGSKEISHRYLCISEVVKKTSGGWGRKLHEGGEENFADNNTSINNTSINNLSGFHPLKEGDNIKNPPSSAAPPTQATSETIGQKANRLIQILGRDVTIPSVVSSLKKALEKDTRENILSGFENYAKKVSFGRVYPQTLLKDETYKQYIVEKEKPARLAKLEEMLASPKRRTHPTEQSSYGGMRQYQGLLPQEEEEYNKLSIEFYGEVMTKNVFRFYPE